MTITITKEEFKRLTLQEQMKIIGMQREMWYKTEEFKAWEENPTEENLIKAKAKRRELVW